MSITGLFLQKDPYRTDTRRFLYAVSRNFSICTKKSEEYRNIVSKSGFNGVISSEDDLKNLPAIPTLYFKRNNLFFGKSFVKAVSSGTSGKKSTVSLNLPSLVRGLFMVKSVFSYHGILSLRPTNYIILSFPHKHTDLGAAKTAYGATKFAPDLKRKYALKLSGNEYVPDTDGVIGFLLKCAEKNTPVRFVGFPLYMYILARELEKRDLHLKLNKHSKIILGGGWKSAHGFAPSYEEFYSLIKNTLGIDKGSIHEFFSAAEHPIAYCKCKNGHFHVPKYSRVLIRDAQTFEPLGFGKPGILNLITPMVTSQPLLSIVTDDIAVLHNDDCGCGIHTPYFELIGRASSSIKTCSVSAAEVLGEKHGISF